MTRRCPWADAHPLLAIYHDVEWGVPLFDDGKLFEFLVLEGMQAGLSWLTVLKKREAFRRVFDGFAAPRIARYGQAKVRALLRDSQIIRNRLKIEAAITNAQALLRVQEREGSFQRFLWDVVDGRPVQHRWRSMRQLPARTPLSDRLSQRLRDAGFRFVGSTICYAHMQATGMVNDHLMACDRHAQVARLSKRNVVQ